MKYTLSTLLICLLFACGGVKAQYVTIPDTAFRSYLVTYFPGAFNASQQMDTTNSEIVNSEYGIYISNAAVKDLEGLQYFKRLKQVIVRFCQLQSIPSFPDSVTEILIDGNYLTALPDLPVTLTNLVIQNNRLTGLPALPNKLKQLLADYNYLIAVPSLPDSLTLFSCSHNKLTSLPTLPDSLRQFNCEHNMLTALPALPNNLWHFVCGYNYFNSLPNNLPGTIEHLYCDSLNLTTLPALPPNLRYFNCGINKLTSLPYIPTLISLQCYSNLLTSLPPLGDSLFFLDCSRNMITSLPALPDTLSLLGCGDNLLTSLPVLNRHIQQLECYKNQLTSLPQLEFLEELKILTFWDNQVTVIPKLPHHLNQLIADNNPGITTIPALPDTLNTLSVSNLPNLHCLPYLPKSLTYLSYYSTPIGCIPNIPPNCTNISPQTVICDAVNNAYQCQSYPQVYGFVFNDNNSNGIFDNGDVPRANVKALLSNGAYAYTNAQGDFNIAADTIGSYNGSLVSPAFYNAVPLTFVHNLPAYTSEVHDTFALQATLVKDSMGVHITPFLNAARPGFPFTYQVNYDNAGSTVLSPRIVLKYDATRMLYNYSSISGVVQSGDSLVINTNNLLPGEMGSFEAYFIVIPGIVLGSTIQSTITDYYTNTSSSDTSSVVVRGSYDPNDKQATPAMTPTQVAQGNFIDYTVRFQNTGTDTAFNVVIADTLSTMLQNNVLQIIGSSHQCRTTLRNGIVYFEFLNINLPDSNASYLKSNGFIRFRIQPQTSVTLGDDIPNKASIYFDYNAPVITNTVQTHIQASLLPLQLLSYHAALKENKTVINQWITANELNTSHFNIQRSANGREFNTIGKVNAAGGGHSQAYTFVDESATAQLVTNNPLYYRLQITDKDGSMAYSKIETVHLKTGNSFTIHPNPAHYTVTVEGGNLSRIEITDDAGRIVMSKALKNEKQAELSISSLPAGLYMMRITTTSGTVTSEKLVIE